MCHTGWHGHVRKFEHRQCVYGDCEHNRPKFDSNAEFLRHFNRYHAATGHEVVLADDEDDGYTSDYAK